MVISMSVSKCYWGSYWISAGSIGLKRVFKKKLQSISQRFLKFKKKETTSIMAIPDNSLTMVVQIGIFLGCLLATTPGAVGRKSSPIRLVKIGSWKYNENNGDIWGYMGFSIVVLVPQARWMVYSMGKSQSKIAKIDDDWGSPIPLGNLHIMISL